MKFLDTNENQINSEIFSNLLQSILPTNPLTIGLVCLASGVGYYSWNYYKNKKQELNTKVIQKNENEKKYLDEYEEKTTLDSNNLVNEVSNISKYKCSMMLNNVSKINQIILDNNNSKNDDEEYDMLNDATNAIQKKEDKILDNNNSKNDEKEYDMLNYATNAIQKKEDKILNNNNSKNDEKEYDMLNDAKAEINDDEWVMIDSQFNAKNTIHKNIL